VDEGRIYSQKEFVLESDMDVKTCMYTIQSSFISNLKNIVMDLINDVKPKTQVKKGITYCSQRLPIDGLIDWNQSNIEIHNFIRSQSYPYPGSYSFLNGKKIIFQKSKLVDSVCYGKPGQIYQILKNGITVVCSNNSLILIKEIIFKGDFINPNKKIKSVKSRFSNYNIEELKELFDK
jgi:methionyl-tRNA formyltransferase